MTTNLPIENLWPVLFIVRKGPNIFFKSYQNNENMLSNLRIGKLTNLS